jgi:ABC-type multidrug transport system fused ATPase/permease subunit
LGINERRRFNVKKSELPCISFLYNTCETERTSLNTCVFRQKLGEISGAFGEYVNGIREVQSFSLEDVVTSEIADLLQEKILVIAKKAALFRGISAGSVQLIQLGVYCLAFYIGARLMDDGVLDFESFNLVL